MFFANSENKKVRLLLTGASGFVGRALRQSLLSNTDCILSCAYRSFPADVVPTSQDVAVGSIGESTDWSNLLAGVDVVVHAAAIAHAQGGRFKEVLPCLDRVNAAATLVLARQAAKAGVKRLVFLSTIKVHGEQTLLNQSFTADNEAAPTDPYAISKWKAEQGLLEVSRETGLEVVIIRSALIYGVGVKANFLNMIRWLHKGIPLPFGAVHNRRSLVALDNLIDLIVTCIDHPAAANQTFLVSDGEDLSTSELLRRMGAALGKPVRLLPVPSWMLEVGAAMLGKKALSQRLCGSLQVDIEKTRNLLNWTPPVSVDEALRKTARHFLEQQGK